MLTRYFEKTDTIKRLQSGLAGPFTEGFALSLEEDGYSRFSICHFLGMAAHLGHWATTRSLTIENLDDFACAAFLRHLDSCRCRPPQSKYGNAAGPVRAFLAYLQKIGAITPRCLSQQETAPLVASFGRWMAQHRGVRESTVELYRPIVAALAEAVDGDPGRFDARNLRAFILERTKHYRSGSKNVTTAARMFLRYLIAEGKCAAGLDAAIPSVAHWQLSTLPRYLPASEVERVIASCNRSTRIGLRDRAIILLLARLGLRAGDVVALEITDIDWRESSMRVSGKGRREVRLPLTQEVGDAILAYLQHGRPQIDTGRLFIRAVAPLRPFPDSHAVSTIVSRAIRRAGIVAHFRGAHVLRHSAATEMLRQGLSLQDIGAVLRHRSIQTTAHYAKIDLALLRVVAQPWPEVTSC